MKVEEDTGRLATRVSVALDTIIDDVVEEPLRKEQVNIAPGYVSVQFRGEELRHTAKAEAETDDENALLLVIDQEGEWTIYMVSI